MTASFNFCTLFNSNYLTRGLQLYNSLRQHCSIFHLYIFAFDEDTLLYLKKHKLVNTTVVSLKELENPELLIAKKDRTTGEYCWTCTPSTILYCIEQFGLDHCTYLDADIRFFSDPSVLFEEFGEEDSILITEHRYTSEYDMTDTSGKYCVQFITFRNSENGMTALRWWKNECIKWCYARFEDNKFGDQKYLDDWLTRFKGVHELQHPGGGAAPWNVQQYVLSEKNGRLFISLKDQNKIWDLVFYHYHDLTFYDDGSVNLTGGLYFISEKVKTHIYLPYIEELKNMERKIKGVTNPNGNISKNENIRLSLWLKKMSGLFRKKIKPKLHNNKYYVADLLKDTNN